MLAILVPARNEEENIGFVLDILTEITSSPEDIFVIDNNSTDNIVIIIYHGRNSKNFDP